ncbi:MAG: S1C family serine protease [Candidatus Merdivicinus sp.]|jgi:serine protease Do
MMENYNMNQMNEQNMGPQNPQRHEKKTSPYLTKKMGALVAALCILASGSAGYAAGVFHAGIQTNSSASQTAPLPSDSNSSNISTMAATTGSSSGALSVTEIAEQVANTVVEITTEVTEYDNFMRQYVSEGAGSGVILSQDGYIVTNNHVIEGASKITVTLRDGTTYPATLVGTDSQGDIAVVKIEATGLQAAKLGDSDDLKVGDTAVAVGNPLGQLGGTVTDGIISALDREIDLDGKTMTLLQTNAAINPGNSGGGLFNDRGELIGVVVAKSSGSGIEGLGFAVPINTAKEIIDDIMQYGYVKGRVDLGMTTVDITSAPMAMMYGLSGTGVYINSVTEGSNAEAVGFRSGDRILSFNGTEINSGDDLTSALSSCKVGDTVEIIISRNGQKYSGQLTLEEAHS